jgi:hypothetical protein
MWLLLDRRFVAVWASLKFEYAENVAAFEFGDIESLSTFPASELAATFGHILSCTRNTRARLFNIRHRRDLDGDVCGRRPCCHGDCGLSCIYRITCKWYDGLVINSSVRVGNIPYHSGIDRDFQDNKD